ncbi:MAG: SEL1-like repeat protein [Azoarcus sp.]|nr:SEL1-like repeat protein [Azoarcus sp.]
MLTASPLAVYGDDISSPPEASQTNTGSQENSAEELEQYRQAADQGNAHERYALRVLKGMRAMDTARKVAAGQEERSDAGENSRNLVVSEEAIRNLVRKHSSPPREEEKWYDKAIKMLAPLPLVFIIAVVVWAYYLGKKEEDEDQKWCQLAAEYGDADAQNRLGVKYAKGDGFKKDDVEAAKWFSLAAEQNWMFAQTNLGKMYAAGRGVAQDDAQAVKWYRKAAEQGDAEAQVSLGRMYATGRGIKRNYADAINWLEKSVEQRRLEWMSSESVSMYLYSAEYIEKAENEVGENLEEDFAEAIKWYGEAAEQGDEETQVTLGKIYAENLGVIKGTYSSITPNEEKALEYLRLAAEQGNAEAQYYIGIVHSNLNAREIYIDGDKMMWKAADQGYAPAQFHLGQTCIRNKEKAMQWIKLAAEQGYAPAQFHLGEMYTGYTGVEQNEAEAEGLKWLRLAAEQGNVEAQASLGLVYLEEEGCYHIEQDYVEAAKWNRKAAEKGDIFASLHLGEMYAKGQGVSQDKAEATKWLMKAALNLKEARKLLQTMEK